MTIHQLQLFEGKDTFHPEDFECSENKKVFRTMARATVEAFDKFSADLRAEYDKTTRSNMLNNLVVASIKDSYEGERLKFHNSLTHTRRSFAVLNEKYILFFKKSPVSNVQTEQDDLIKRQELHKHVLFLVYHVDEFWSTIFKLEFQYLVSPYNALYNYDITKYMNEVSIQMPAEEEISKPKVKIKKDIITKRKVE